MTPLLKNPLPTLADEILALLPTLIMRMPDGVTAQVLAMTLGADIANIRRAMLRLNAEARADLMRRKDSRERFVLPLKHRAVDALRICSHCEAAFDASYVSKWEGGKIRYSRRRCCSRACGIAWSWMRPGVREKRSAGIKVTKNTPEAMARLAAHNKRRWSKAGEREKLAEQNRREWADPVKGKLRAQSIAAVNGSPQMRKFYSDMRKEWWADPAMRQKMMDAMNASMSTKEYRDKLSRLVKERWRDPLWRKKWTAANRIKVAKMAERNRGRKQSAEQIAKRVATTRRTKELRQQTVEAA